MLHQQALCRTARDLDVQVNRAAHHRSKRIAEYWRTLMTFATRCLIFVIAALGDVGFAAQGKPNLSGVWVSVCSQQ